MRLPIRLVFPWELFKQKLSEPVPPGHYTMQIDDVVELTHKEGHPVLVIETSNLKKVP